MKLEGTFQGVIIYPDNPTMPNSSKELYSRGYAWLDKGAGTREGVGQKPLFHSQALVSKLKRNTQFISSRYH